MILEVPQFNNGPFQLPALNSYWQSYHRGTTSAGHTAFRNDRCDDLLTEGSPFNALRLADPNFLLNPEEDLQASSTACSFSDYACSTGSRFRSVSCT